jgi:AraC-like DNA-binding protein
VATTYGGPSTVRLDGEALGRFRDVCEHAPVSRDAGAVDGHVARLWAEAHAARTSSSSKHPLTRRALASLFKDADGGPNERNERIEIAARAGTHPSEVSRHFRKNIGLTLTAYRTRVRLLRFVEYVDGATHTLLSASIAAGFGSYSQCHRAFSSTFGCTPRTFFRRGLGDDMRERFAPPGAARVGAPLSAPAGP